MGAESIRTKAHPAHAATEDGYRGSYLDDYIRMDNLDFYPHEVGLFVSPFDHQTFPVGTDQNQHGIGGGNFVLETVAKITRDLHAFHIHENAAWSVMILQSLINGAARTRRDPVGSSVGKK